MNRRSINLIFVLMLAYGFVSCSHSKKLVITGAEAVDEEPMITIVDPEVVIELPLKEPTGKIILPSFVELKKTMDSAMRRPLH